MSRSAGALLVAVALATSACALFREASDPDAGIPQTSEACPPGSPGCGVTSSSASSSADASTTTGPVSPTEPTTVADSSGEPPTIHLGGSTTVFTPDGIFTVHGWLDRTAEVTVADTQAGVHDDPLSGVSYFDATLDLEPGEHAIEITATDRSGAESTIVLSVLVDPALDVRLADVGDVDLVGRTLLADDVEFLTGEEATIAAREDGAISGDEELPNGYYLRNPDPTPSRVTLGDPGVVVLQACFPDGGPCVVEQAVGLDDWAGLLEDPAAAVGRFGWHWYGAGDSPYWLTIHDGVIVQIREHYLP